MIIRSKDEADRLRLTLGSLWRQASDHEVIVVNDGSTDHTQSVLEDEAARQPLRIVHHSASKGRSAASNAGARIARGDVLLFLDGDTLAGPDALRRHAELHDREPEAVGRGDVFHLRCTRMLLDPETCAPQAEHRETLSRRPAGERELMRVSMEQVLDDFDAIHERAERGVYPGAGPRHLAELEMQALCDPGDGAIAWAAASGSNLSVNRSSFIDSGGFDERLDINEHRELALRLQKAGARLQPVTGARSYHLTHRSGWRDPLLNTEWETIFLAAHPEPAVALLIVFWASLAQGRRLDPEFQIRSLHELQQAGEGRLNRDWDQARRQIGAPTLGTTFWRRTLQPDPVLNREALSA